MGQVHVPLTTAFRALGIPVVPPPPTSKRTLSLGAKHSPESICLPFKLTLGNLIECLEQGADTLIMPTGANLCRFGYYARVQEQILTDLGFKFQMVRTDLFGSKILGVARLIKQLAGDAPLLQVIAAIRFGLAKLALLDELEREVQRVRARELEKGAATAAFKEAISAVEAAPDPVSLKEAFRTYSERLRAIPGDAASAPLLVGIMGEFYVVLEPFSNMEVEIELGKLGVEVRRSLFVSHWTKFSLFLNAFGITEKERLHRAARPYLSRDVGGDGWESVGEKVLHAAHYDGLVHLAPFTCMPEIIAQNIMPAVNTDIPVLTIVCDEQMGRAGLATRLEAFVDLLRRRRSRGRALAPSGASHS